jgi:hypothetical protein
MELTSAQVGFTGCELLDLDIERGRFFIDRHKLTFERCNSQF